MRPEHDRLQPWRDFNDAPAQPDDEPFCTSSPEPAQIAVFLDVVFGYCEGLIPLRGFIDKGQGSDGKPHNIWIEADADAALDEAGNFARVGGAREAPPSMSSRARSRTHGQAEAADVAADADAWWSTSTPATSPPSSTIWSATSASRR